MNGILVRDAPKKILAIQEIVDKLNDIPLEDLKFIAGAVAALSAKSDKDAS